MISSSNSQIPSTNNSSDIIEKENLSMLDNKIDRQNSKTSKSRCRKKKKRQRKININYTDMFCLIINDRVSTFVRSKTFFKQALIQLLVIII